MDLEPDTRSQHLRVTRREACDQEAVQGQGADRHRDAAKARQAGYQGTDRADISVGVEHDTDDVSGRERDREDQQVLVPGKDPLRQLPGRFVDRVAEDQAHGDDEGQDEVGRRPGGASDEPDPHLGLIGARRGHDLVR